MKRILLTLTFVAALGAASLGLSSTAEAGHGCYDVGHHGYSSYYPVPYGGWGYPRVSYYRDYGYPHRHRQHHHGHHHHGRHHRDRGGVYFSIGF